MKRLKYIFLLLISILLFNYCKDEKEIITTFPVPSWSVDATGKYQASMTAVVNIPSNLIPYMSENDILAAFIDDECRGIAQMIDIGTGKAFFILIKGTPDEQKKVNFKYYCTKNSFMYETGLSLVFEADSSYGNADLPIVLALKIIK